jgi:hypothetical protein
VPCGLALVGGVGFDVLLAGMLRVLFGVDRVGMRECAWWAAFSACPSS